PSGAKTFRFDLEKTLFSDQISEKIDKTQKTEKTRNNYKRTIVNIDSDYTHTSNNMVETRRQVRNKSRTPYQHPQTETNGQKRQKTNKEEQKQIASMTIAESHVTQTRDVDHNNNTHQTDGQPTSTEDTTVNIDPIDETLSDADDWNEISFTARYKIYIAIDHAQGETRWEKRKFFEDFFPTNIRIIGTSIKQEN